MPAAIPGSGSPLPAGDKKVMKRILKGPAPALAALLALLVVVAYAPAFRAEPVWDDQILVEQQLPRFESLRDVFFPPPDITRWSYAYYRPVVTASYLADRWLFGPDAVAGPHAMNLLYHTLATLLVGALALHVFAGTAQARAAAFAAAVVFALHPIHSESVSWMAGRSDVLATLGVLAALLLALRWRDGGQWLALAASPLCLGVGLLAKESAITALALLPLAWFTVPAAAGQAAPHRRRLALACLAWAGAAAGYLALRSAAGSGSATAVDLPAIGQLGRMLQGAAWYALKLVQPWPQSAIVTWEMTPGGAFAALILALVVALTAAGALRFVTRGAGTLLLATGWLWATLTLPLWVAALAATNTPLAERYLYLPSVSIALLAGAVFGAARGGGPAHAARGAVAALHVVAALLCAAMLAATVQRGLVWQNALALWSDAAARAPGEGLVWENLGLSRWRAGDETGALAAFERALDAEGYDARGRARAENAIGAILRGRGAGEEAVAHFRRAVALNPAYAEAWYGLGAVYEGRAGTLASGAGGDAARDAAMELAIHYYRTALQRYPGYHPARLKLAATLAAEARRHAQDARPEAAGTRRAEARALLDPLIRALDADPRPDARAVLAGQVGVDIDQLQQELQ